MALTIPIYNLEENLDIYLKSPFESIKNLKSHIEAIVEDDFFDDLSTVDQTWIEYLQLDYNLSIDKSLEIFYVIKLLKNVTVEKQSETTGDIQPITFAVGSKLLIPQSFINTELTTNMQLEPNTYVLDFPFDYTNEAFIDPDDMMSKVIDFIKEQSNSLIEPTSRKVSLFKEEDLKSILRLLNIYYSIDLPTDLLDLSSTKKPNTVYGEYNRDSIKNVLSSAINNQVVISSVSIGDKITINRKIEISLVPNEQRQVQCVIYNRTKSEIKTFRY